jgi:ABC-type uncharacterized transport system substrate-binding protein
MLPPNPLQLDISMRNRLLALFAVAAGVCFAAPPALAHPHVWVVMKSEFAYAPDGSITGVRHAWTFDDMFSTFATQGLDQKTKGVFTREELAPLAEVNMTSLKEFDYFTYGTVDGKKTSFGAPKDYWLEFKNSELTLHFTLPLAQPVVAKSVSLEVYDPSYYVDFAFAEKEPVSLAGAPAGCKLTVGKPQELTKELAQMLAQIPQGGQIPANSYGAQFANKVTISCP